MGQDMSKIFDVFEPFYNLSKNKQKEILQIISDTIKEVVVFLFILVNKNIIPFILNRINSELNNDLKDN